MVSFEMTVAALGRTRFAISPMWELVSAIRMLSDPDSLGPHVPWARGLDGALDEVDLAFALRLSPPEGYIPDFLTPPPTTPLARFEDELETIRTTDPAQVAAEIGWLRESRPEDPHLAALQAAPDQTIARLVPILEELWRITLEPIFPRVRSLLEADIAHRARVLTESGPAALFGELHPGIRYANERIEVHASCTAERDLGGLGLLIVPSAFAWSRPYTILDEPWQPTLLYPARGIDLLWEPGEPAPEALAELIGGTRARLLTALRAPASTTELARRLELAPGGVSQHLKVLAGSGLVCSRREGRSVLYTRTDRAEELLGTGTGAAA